MDEPIRSISASSLAPLATLGLGVVVRAGLVPRRQNWQKSLIHTVILGRGDFLWKHAVFLNYPFGSYLGHKDRSPIHNLLKGGTL